MSLLQIRPDRLEFSDKIFLRTIAEIEADIKRGVLPNWIGDFDDLVHMINHRDSYGGLCTEEVHSQWSLLYEDESHYSTFCTELRLRVHLWLMNRPGAIPGARFNQDFSELLGALTIASA